jgi:plasmid stabilization system protein ParE
MTYSISISEAAENDISEAYLWYEDQKENLGSIFEVQFQRAVKSIRNNPFKTQIRYGNIRVYFLQKFPFGIHFEIKENDIRILAVFQTSRDSEKWERRPGST